MTVTCHIDTFDRDELPDDMLLHAARIDGAWNGFPVPVATAAEFRRVIAALARNDPNGTWTVEHIAEGDGALIYEDECGRSVWAVVDVVDGAPAYALHGWTWSTDT
jgi:hypothetical protein